jgi:hypothetical protein
MAFQHFPFHCIYSVLATHKYSGTPNAACGAGRVYAVYKYNSGLSSIPRGVCGVSGTSEVVLLASLSCSSENIVSITLKHRQKLQQKGPDILRYLMLFAIKKPFCVKSLFLAIHVTSVEVRDTAFISREGLFIARPRKYGIISAARQPLAGAAAHSII